MSDPWPLVPSILALAISTVVLVLVGTRLARTADDLAERTRLGGALAGALLLGAVTSLSGIITTATGALQGDAAFALANPVGGVAIQSVWIAIADLVYRRANLEHAAASLANLLQSLVLVALLSLPVIAYATPDLTLGWIHPVTLAIPVIYLYGLRLVRLVEKQPQWRPRRTRDTSTGEGVAATSTPLSKVWTLFGVYAVLVGCTGWVIARGGLSVVDATGMPSGVAGFTLTTAISSLPELVTLVAAVRMGALAMGVGAIIGGNVFDTLMISVADVFYRDGSIYAHAGPASLVLVGGTMLTAVVLAAGLVVRQQRGIGFEGFAIPGVYAGTVALAVVAS